MGNISGVVSKVTKGKGQAVTKMGTYDRINVTITSESGETVLVQKLVKPGNDGQKLVGQRVQCTYITKEVDLPDGTSFKSNSTDSKGFVLLDQPKFVPGGTATTSTGTKAPYNQEGARTGMLANSGLKLAIARANLQGANDVSTALLRESIGMMETEVKRLEHPQAVEDPKPLKTSKPAVKAPAIEEDDNDPFA